MADSIRQQICTKVAARLATILTTAGYATNLGQHVYEWLPEVLEQSNTLGVVWKDIDESPSNLTTGGTLGYHYHDLKFEFTIIASGSTAIANVRKALADVIKAIGVDQTWDKLADRTVPVPNEMAAEQADRIVAAFRLTVIVQYRTHKWDPYNQ
jgi:hypothetical protein